MLILYRVFLYLAFPLVLLRLLWRALGDRRYFERMNERFGFAGARPAVAKKAGGIWIHAVSVGEVNAAAPLVEYLLENYPHKMITVTTMTPTGADRVGKIFAGRVAHRYLPYDYPGAVRRFLATLRPCVGLVMETEIWPNLITRCHRLGVPLLYLNVRLSRRAHRGYRRFRGLIRPALEKIDRFAVQSRLDARRLHRLGAPSAALSVTGSLKFDIEPTPDFGEAARLLRRQLGWERPVWVVGSTHEGEESQILEAFARLRKTFKSLLLVLAPRHPQRANAVFRLCARRGYRTVLRSRGPREVSADTDIHLADTLGELPLLIAAGDIAFIGGSLTPVGGHNVLEASAAGIPVVFGRYMFNFAEIADLLLRRDAGIQVMDGGELAEVVERFLADPQLRAHYGKRGKELIAEKRGALEKICAMVDEVLADVAEGGVGRKRKIPIL